jgi:hypothetical protein
MTLFGDLPAWAVVLLALLAAAILAMLNVGWLLSAKALLDGLRNKPRSPSGPTGPAVADEPKDGEP